MMLQRISWEERRVGNYRGEEWVLRSPDVGLGQVAGGRGEVLWERAKDPRVSTQVVDVRESVDLSQMRGGPGRRAGTHGVVC